MGAEYRKWSLTNHSEIVLNCKKETVFAEILLQTRTCHQTTVTPATVTFLGFQNAPVIKLHRRPFPGQ